MTISLASACIAQTAKQQSFDGTYSGTTQLIGSDTTSCSAGQMVTLDVRDGQFHQPWRPRQTFDVKIGSDGRFYARSGAITAQSDKHMMVVPVIEGQVSGKRLTADYGTRWCHYRLDASRI